MSNKVLIAIITHNRSNLLEKCIKAVLKQTYSNTELLIVNNGSTDNTEEVLRKYTVHTVNQENLGSAGGWNSAIKFLLEGEYDFIWAMDDDGHPHEEALEILMKNYKDSYACLSSLVVQEDGAKLVFPMPLIRNNRLPPLLPFVPKIKEVRKLKLKAKGNIYPYAHPFNGLLINKKVINLIGNVEKGYFLYGDEVDYFCRMQAVGETVTCLDAIHYHPDVSKRPFSEIKFYYYLRNSIILNKKYFNLYLLRNIKVIVAALVRLLLRNKIKDFFIFIFVKNLLLKAISSGLRNELGKDLV